MNLLPNILDLASNRPLLTDELEVLQEIERNVPGSVKYSIKRFLKQKHWNIEDTGILNYHLNPDHPDDNYLELNFCVSGNFYCREKQTECDFCKFNASEGCIEKLESVDVLSFIYSPAYLHQFAKAHKNENSLIEKVVSFKHPKSFSKTACLCNKTSTAIQGLLNHNYSDTRENIFINAQTQLILLYTTDCLLGEKEEADFGCKFLANEEDRQKIIDSREILLQHIGDPITIKALSRKVAINECYLKKGFKEIFGTTIFDFYQSQRMEHAKYLLYDKGLSVTEVSNLLGYSSISHFSTAFKNHTGIKPCELLVH
jgi:AraC-like DNA-binding protein